MSFTTDTFLPPVLAVGAGANDNGRNNISSGLRTHKGIFDANSLRATGALYPQHGKGLEILFNQTTGGIQSYDRDAPAWCDLYISAKNITLTPNAGGKVSAPVGSFNRYLGGNRFLVNWNAPAPGTWYESPVQITATVTSTSSMVRVEATGHVTSTTIGAQVFVGFGVDGGLVTDSLQLLWVPAANAPVSYCFTTYWPPTTAGSHRFATFVYVNTNTTGFSTSAYQSLYVNEQIA